MTEVLAQIFRVPSDGRPLTILDLSSVPSEVLNVVMSAMFRLSFDLAFWSQGRIPITLVCEEAHRYAPAKGASFEPTRRAMARIAKEGRKYGVSLCIVTQRPSELDPTVLSQCNTVLALRLTNQLDQEFVKSATSESGVALLDFLPVLGKAEAIVMGEGVPLPLRIRFDELDRASGLPNGQSAPFSEVWSQPAGSVEELDDIVANWRAQRRLGEHEPAPFEPPAPPPPPPAEPPRTGTHYAPMPPLAGGPPPLAAPRPATPGITLRPGSLLNSIRKTT
jgi:DNA helicase HerA-like ATPase